MQKRSLPTYIEWSSEFRTPQLLSDKKNYDYPPNLKCIPNFGPLNSYPRKNDDYHLTWDAFRISDTPTLILQENDVS